MRLRTRFTLIGFFIAIFLILTPWIVFYALGYKYDFHTRSIVKTGIMVVRTEPDGADIFLNGELNEKQSPAVIRFLLPGDYEVRVAKDGYQPWAKRLDVKQRLVTWVNLNRDFIPLFFNEPQLAQTIQAGRASLSKNRDSIGLATGAELKVLWTDNGAEQAAGNFAASEFRQPIAWQNTNQIFSLNRLTLLTAQQISEIRRIETYGAFVALDIGRDLYLISNAKLVLVEKGISSFDFSEAGLWYVKKQELKNYNLDTGAVQILSDALPAYQTAQIHLLGNKVYVILDNTLYVYNENFEKIHSPAAALSWDAGSRQLLFAGPNELGIYDPASKTTELILRSLTPVSQARINAADGYIFFVNDGQIKAIELDGRGQRNVYTILKGYDNASQFTLSADGKFLYIIKTDKVEKYLVR